MHTILIIESNDTLREMNSRFLEQKFNVISSRDAEKGMELMREKKPDLVITNAGKPGNAHGFRVAVFANEQGIPFLINSGSPFWAFEKDEVGSINEKCFISKPYTLSDLLNRISATLQVS